MAGRTSWKVVGLFVLLTILFVAGAGGIWLKRVLDDPNSGKLTGISETDEYVNETRTILFNSGRIKSIRRSVPARVSAQIEKELSTEGLAPLVPFFEQFGRKDWLFSRQAGFAGPTIQIYGTARCDPRAISIAAQSLAGVMKSKSERENGVYLSGETKLSRRNFFLNLSRRDGGEYALSFVLFPKPGTALIRADELKPYSEMTQVK